MLAFISQINSSTYSFRATFKFLPYFATNDTFKEPVLPDIYMIFMI